MNCQFVADHYGPRPSANPVDRIPRVFAPKRKCPRLSGKVFQQIRYHARGLPVGVPGVNPPGMAADTRISNPRNDGTRNGGTTERETEERDFFSVFFFFFFFNKKTTTDKQ